MNETVDLTCPACKTHWKQSLDKLERLEVLYKDASFDLKGAVVKYRVKCVCGKYLIFEVSEE